MDTTAFHQGRETAAYRYLGCHPAGEGFVFRLWAPRAERVFVTGDFCSWGQGSELWRTADGEIFEGYAMARPGDRYKFRLSGVAPLKGDPYAFASESGGGASCVCFPSAYRWQDGAYLRKRRKGDFSTAPLYIYEVHPASFGRRGDGGYLSWEELSERLLCRCREFGFTHVELMGAAEYPYDGSWGYQVGAMYAPTARHGTPEDFCAFVDRMHLAGVGVLLDWVPAHFPRDAWGLADFDGGTLYEYGEPWRADARGWGTRYFDLGRGEVRSFLISNALFWAREYHIDGLRVDAVAAMLYRDYDRQDGEWTPNMFGDNRNLEAMEFFRLLHGALARECSDVLTVAEESTAFPGVTAPVEQGGLGFSLKWNMGYANDLFAYLRTDPLYRRYHHRALNFPMLYAYSERFVLPVSHDEVVYGKGALFDKPFGSHGDKLAQLRAFYLFFMTFPGKKLLFMGCEFGQEEEWDYRRALPFEEAERPDHAALAAYTAALGRFYRQNPALYAADFSPAGFTWIAPDEADANLVVYQRHGAGQTLYVAVSFSGGENRVTLPVREGGVYRCVFHTHACTEDVGEKEDFSFRLPPFGGAVLEFKTEESSYQEANHVLQEEDHRHAVGRRTGEPAV